MPVGATGRSQTKKSTNPAGKKHLARVDRELS